MYTTIPAAPWSSGFDIHLDDLSLEGSDEGDEDDNIALRRVLVSCIAKHVTSTHITGHIKIVEFKNKACNSSKLVATID